MSYLTLAYKGAHSNTLYTAYFDGQKWHGNTKISDQAGGISPQSDQNPATCLYNNSLYLLYKGAGLNDVYMARYDGLKWYGDEKVKDMAGGVALSSDASPSLAVFNGVMYAIYKGAGTNDVYIAWYNESQWSGGVKISSQNGGISPTTDQGLQCCVYRDHLYIVHKQPDSNSLYCSLFDGTTWSGNSKIDKAGFTPATDRNPDLCVYSDRMYVTYKGAGTDDLYIAYLDGQGWHGDTKIPAPIAGGGPSFVAHNASENVLSTANTKPSGSNPQSNYTPGTVVFDNRLYLVYKGAHSNDLYTAYLFNSLWFGNTRVLEQGGGIFPETNYGLHPTISPTSPGNLASWLGKIGSATLLCDINLPGTHDSAAINRAISTPYACHSDSLTGQLEGGIRLLDIRIKVKKDATGFTFVTCHGDFASALEWTEYQGLPSALDECKAFLARNPSETVAISLKIDDWNGNDGVKDAALKALAALVYKYPTLREAKAVTLGEARGKFYLINRITDDLTFGVPVAIPYNTSGVLAASNTNRSFEVYVQDQFEKLPPSVTKQGKLDLFTAAWSQKAPGKALINFASGTTGVAGLSGVYIQSLLIAKLGESPAATRPKNFGWSLFDYEFQAAQTDVYSSVNCVQLIIASNFGYQGYEKAFQLAVVATEGEEVVAMA